MLTAALILGWFTANYFSPERKFDRAYTAYRAIELPDSSRLDEWDKQMTEAYLTMKEAFNAGNEDQAKGHQKVFLQIVGAQEQFCLKMNTAYAEEAKALPELKAQSAAMSGKEKTIAERIAKNEATIHRVGKALNDGALEEMRLWRTLNDNFSRFMNSEIDGSTFLAEEDKTGKAIAALRESQAAPGLRAENMLQEINADWKELKELL